jgi:hypothetical protein
MGSYGSLCTDCAGKRPVKYESGTVLCMVWLSVRTLYWMNVFWLAVV